MFSRLAMAFTTAFVVAPAAARGAATRSNFSQAISHDIGWLRNPG